LINNDNKDIQKISISNKCFSVESKNHGKLEFYKNIKEQKQH